MGARGYEFASFWAGDFAAKNSQTLYDSPSAQRPGENGKINVHLVACSSIIFRFVFAALPAIVFALLLQMAVGGGRWGMGNCWGYIEGETTLIGNWTGSVVGVRGVISGAISPS